MIELLGDIIEWVVDLFDGGEAVPGIVEGGGDLLSTAFDVVSTALLIQGAIYVTTLTVDSIKSELSNRRELKNKGVTNVVIQDFIRQNGRTVVSLAALNAQNKQVGSVNIESRSSDYSSLKVGQKIQL